MSRWRWRFRRRVVCRRSCRTDLGHTFRRGCLLRAPWDD